VLVSRVDGGPIFPDRLFATHDRLSRDVTAPLRKPLVLEVNPATPVLMNSWTVRIVLSALPVAVIGIGDDRNAHRGLDHRRNARHLGHGEKAHVRPPVGMATE